jgi:hypothetical protein
VGTPFDGKISWQTQFLEKASFQQCTTAEIVRFCQEVTILATERSFDSGISGGPGHYTDHPVHDRYIAHLNHLIECRNVISAVWENVKRMESEAYCGHFISLIVLDSTRHGVARLVRIECSRIQQLVIDFELCLFQVMSLEPNLVLAGVITEISKDVSAACRDLLTDLNMNILGPGRDIKDIWRCAVHVLDMAVLSYAGAHTQFFGDPKIASVALPGPFLETRYFIFRRRSFSCLGKFLGGQEAWVLEMQHPIILQGDLPDLSLSADVVTFGDIWGPMWKSCVLGDEERIIQYNVGNGVILPWNLPTLASQHTIEVRKGEVYCHWMSHKDSRDRKYLDKSSTGSLHENDVLLIGASVRLVVNDKCGSSTTDQKQHLREIGSLSEPGTVKKGRVLSAEIIQVQVSPPYGSVGYQREYKREGRTMNQCLIEDWKFRPLNRQVRCLEFNLGLEVSTCTHNARRIPLIKLLGTQTMLNHLNSGSLRWISTECEEKFYSALRDADHTAFRILYESQPDWRTDLGNAIEYCLDALEDTGKSGNQLGLFWAPDAKPGQKVTLRTSELSWIGFLEETESSGTLAVLEDRCLELRTLGIGKKCQNYHFPRRIGSRLSNHGKVFDGSMLETSVHLNESCVPRSIRQGRIKSVRRDGSAPSHEYRWSVSLLQEGDSFGFGAKGFLKAITPFWQGQILAEWSESSGIVQSMRSTIRDIAGSTSNRPAEKMHYECIRDEEWNTSPVDFLIISTARNIPCSSQISRRSSLHSNSTSVNDGIRPYDFDPTEKGRPRTGTFPSLVSQNPSNKLREIINNWIRTQNSPEWSSQESERRL